MKINKLFALFLACLMIFSMTVFTACDDETVPTTDNGGSNITPSGDSQSNQNGEDGSSSSDDTSGNTNNNANQNNETNAEAMQALKEALERTFKSNNHTQTITGSSSQSAVKDGETTFWCQIKDLNLVEKTNSIKSESKATQIVKYDPLDSWKTELIWNFKEYISENEAIEYNWDEESASWQIGRFSIVQSDNESDAEDKMLEDIYNQFQYNESTGIYTLAECNADAIALEFFMGRNVEIESGGATARYRNLEIELKDGYLYRYYAELEVQMDITTQIQGELCALQAEMIQSHTVVFSDFGTTIVTLPAVN